MYGHRERADPSSRTLPSTSSVSDAVDVGLRVIAGADQSESSLRKRLLNRGFEPATIESAVERLRQYGYLNDTRLAQSIALRKVRNGYGRRRIAADLHGRGVDNDAIDLALDGVDSVAEQDSCRHVATRWLDRHPMGSTPGWKQSLGAMLQRRGFGFDVIQSALRDLDDEVG